MNRQTRKVYIIVDEEANIPLDEDSLYGLLVFEEEDMARVACDSRTESVVIGELTFPVEEEEVLGQP